MELDALLVRELEHAEQQGDAERAREIAIGLGRQR
jgi:hypothetical protein